MENITWDWALFDILNFAGPAWLDSTMRAISGIAMWIPLYLLIIYMVWRRYSWRGIIALIVAMGISIALADLTAGIFKHSGPLANLWAEFPARPRPMFTEGLEDVHAPSLKHGRYGTVSAHASTIVAISILSIVAVGRRWFTWIMCLIALLICYSRIYLACHFPQDILLGMVIGILSALAGVALFKKIAIKRE